MSGSPALFTSKLCDPAPDLTALTRPTVYDPLGFTPPSHGAHRHLASPSSPLPAPVTSSVTALSCSGLLPRHLLQARALFLPLLRWRTAGPPERPCARPRGIVRPGCTRGCGTALARLVNTPLVDAHVVLSRLVRRSVLASHQRCTLAPLVPFHLLHRRTPVLLSRLPFPLPDVSLRVKRSQPQPRNGQRDPDRDGAVLAARLAPSLPEPSRVVLERDRAPHARPQPRRRRRSWSQSECVPESESRGRASVRLGRRVV